MTVVVVPKYDLRQMLHLIDKHSISHLMYVYALTDGAVTEGLVNNRSLVPPQAVALSKVSYALSEPYNLA